MKIDESKALILGHLQVCNDQVLFFEPVRPNSKRMKSFLAYFEFGQCMNFVSILDSIESLCLHVHVVNAQSLEDCFTLVKGLDLAVYCCLLTDLLKSSSLVLIKEFIG